MNKDDFAKQSQVLRNKKYAKKTVLSQPEIKNGVVKVSILPKMVKPRNMSIPAPVTKKTSGCSGCKRK